MRQVFDSTTIDPQIEREQRWIDRLREMRSSAGMRQGEQSRARMIEFCDRAIKDAEKVITEFEKVKAMKSRNRDELLRIINSLNE
jgi:hypothetical protein